MKPSESDSERVHIRSTSGSVASLKEIQIYLDARVFTRSTSNLDK